MTQPRLDRQRSAPLFLPTPSIKPTTPLTAFSQHFATISGQENPTSDGQPDLAKKGFRVQRSHRRVEPVFENGARVRCFEVMPSDRVHLFHGLPFQKYNQSLVSEFEFQRMIVVNELKLLLDKGKSLKAKFNDTPDLALFDLVDEKIQQGFNAIFEETVGLVFIVTEILMACE